MNESAPAGAGWFEGLDPGDIDGASEAITEGGADTPEDWPTLAIEADHVDSEREYYEWLQEAAVEAARKEARARERADDQQLKHSVRAMDDCERTANELAERVAEWAASRYDDAGAGVEYAHTVAERTPEDTVGASADAQLISLAKQVDALAEEAEEIRSFLSRTAPDVVPNLATLAGPVLAARLIALAGGLESLAKKPSGTVQILGAEDALFAHLRGNATSPKHGVIYTHEAVKGTHPEHRGSAARALAGKLSIAARIDYYSGDFRPELEAELADRIETIQARSTGGDDE